MTRVVPRLRTPLRIDEMMRIGAEAYTLESDAIPSTNELAMAAAQWTCEHGVQPHVAHGTKGERVIWSIWNHNWGNITCEPSDDCDKTELTTKERVARKGVNGAEKDVWKTMTLCYVAHESHLDGARAYWRRLAEKYGASLDAFATGNTRLVAETLSKQRYYTGLVDQYASNLAYYFPLYTALLSTGNERPRGP